MIFLAAQAHFYLNSLMRLKCLMLASCSVVCQMQRAEEAEMPPQAHGHPNSIKDLTEADMPR